MEDFCGCRHSWWWKGGGFMPLGEGELQDE